MPNYKRYYFSNHYVFITVVTYKRNNILIKNIDLLRECMIKTKEKFVFDIFAIVILPNHLHMIIKPEKIKDFSLITGSIKRRFTKSIDEKYKNADISESKLKRKEKGVWQRRFYDHIIRNEDDLHKHLDYIHYNPVKHGCVKNVKEWEYSSFQKFVKTGNYENNWGSNSSDIKHLEKLNYE